MANLILQLMFLSFSHASFFTTAEEQKTFISEFSGASSIGESLFLADRYSDSEKIDAAISYLEKKYAEAGLKTIRVDYNPLDVFVYYKEDINNTYRNYFRMVAHKYSTEFGSFCKNEMTVEEAKKIDARIERIHLSKEKLCAAKDPFETYVVTSVDYTTEITKKILLKRKKILWTNLIAYDDRNLNPEKPLCIVGAHMDSIARDGGGRGPVVSPIVAAPGADDNASGTSAVFTLGKLLTKWIADKKINSDCEPWFVHFSGEEEGLFGSLSFVHHQNKRPVRWMINIDMIGYNKSISPKWNVGYRGEDDITFSEFKKLKSKLPVVFVEKNTFIYSSDQISFWNVGVPAISISEQACSKETCDDYYIEFNPHIHSVEDEVSKLNFNYAAEVINGTFNGIQLLLDRKSR